MRRVVASAVILAVLLVACGGGEDGDAAEATAANGDAATAVTSPATADATTEGAGDGGAAADGPCGWVSDDAMSALLGVDVSGTAVDPTLCEYAPATGAPGSEVLAADLFSNTAFDEACSLEFDNTGRGDPVAGLANEAFWKGNESGSIGTAQLLFCTGDRFWTVTLYVPADRTDDMLAIARSVAEAALTAS